MAHHKRNKRMKRCQKEWNEHKGTESIIPRVPKECQLKLSNDESKLRGTYSLTRSWFRLKKRKWHARPTKFDTLPFELLLQIIDWLIPFDAFCFTKAVFPRLECYWGIHGHGMTISHLRRTLSRDNFHYLGTARLPEFQIFESYSLNTSPLSKCFRKDAAHDTFVLPVPQFTPEESLAPNLDQVSENVLFWLMHLFRTHLVRQHGESQYPFLPQPETVFKCLFTCQRPFYQKKGRAGKAVGIMMEQSKRCMERSPPGIVHRRLVLAGEDAKELVRTMALRIWCEGVKGRVLEDRMWTWALRAPLHWTPCYDRFYNDATFIEEALKIGYQSEVNGGKTEGEMGNVQRTSGDGVGGQSESGLQHGREERDPTLPPIGF